MTPCPICGRPTRTIWCRYCQSAFAKAFAIHPSRVPDRTISAINWAANRARLCMAQYNAKRQEKERK